MPPNSNQRYDNQQAPGNNPAAFANYVTPEVINSPPSGKKKLMVILAVVLLLLTVIVGGLLFTGAISINPDQTRRDHLATVAESIAQFRETEGYIPFDFEIDTKWEEIRPDVSDPATGEPYELIILDDSPVIGQISYRKTADFDFEICTKLESVEEPYCLTNPRPEQDEAAPTTDSPDSSQN